MKSIMQCGQKVYFLGGNEYEAAGKFSSPFSISQWGEGVEESQREADEMLRSYVSENYGEGIYEASHSVEGTSVPVYKLDRKSAFRPEDYRASSDWTA